MFSKEKLADECKSVDASEANVPICTAKKHDQYSFETKLDYMLHEEKKQNRFSITSYFFIPKQFKINEDTYSKEEFFADLTHNIRFKTPEMALSGILNPRNHLSPLFTVRKRIRKIRDGRIEPKDFEIIDYNLRLLGCMVRASLRDQLFHLFAEYDDDMPTPDLHESINSYLDQIYKFTNRMKKLNREFSTVQIPEQLRESFVLVDEYISLTVETYLTKAIILFQNDDEMEKITERCIRLVEYHQRYRRTKKSSLVSTDEDKKEVFDHWKGTLKKFVQGRLYLRTIPTKDKTTTMEVLYGVGAGLAMLISLLFTFWLAYNYTKDSLPFIIVVIIAFVLRDRIKANIRKISSRYVGSVFSDRKMRILGPASDKGIGRTLENVDFMKLREVPAEILNLRRASEVTTVEKKGKPEVVLKYKNEVILNTKKIRTDYERRQHINDLIRFNLRNYLRYLDDPVEHRYVWNAEERAVEKITTNRIYHMNVVLVLKTIRSKKKWVRYKRVRLLLDQNGIKRLERVKTRQ